MHLMYFLHYASAIEFFFQTLIGRRWKRSFNMETTTSWLYITLVTVNVKYRTIKMIYKQVFFRKVWYVVRTVKNDLIY